MRLKSFVLGFTVFTLSVFALAPVGRAQDEPTADDRITSIEEIVVTAEKKESTLQQTPISLQAFTAQDLDKLRIENVFDLQAKVTNLQMTPFPLSQQTLRMVIRGIGTNDVQITQDPSVGVYLDGVYVARATGLALDVVDLQRVEVLRGPQGTLYGRNATGGAVNLITAPPDLSKFGFKQTVSVGSRSLAVSKTQLNVPVNDTLAMKLNFMFGSQDGFMDNSGPGKDFGDENNYGGRFALRWLPVEQLTVDYTFDYSVLTAAGYPYQSLEPATVRGLSSDAFSLVASADRSHYPRRQRALKLVNPYQETKDWVSGHALTLAWEVNDSLTLKSISAYRSMEEQQYADLAGETNGDLLMNNGPVTPIPGGTTLPGTRPDLNQRQFSQELQAIGNVGETWEYLAGAYYFQESARETNQYDKATRDAVGPLHAQIWLANYPFPGVGTLRGQAYDIFIKNKSYAFYTQVSWLPDFFEHKLRLTGGIRYTVDSREADRVETVVTSFEPQPGFLPPLCILDPSSCFSVDAAPSQTFRKWTPSATVAYDWTDDFNTYAKYVRGYKSGGYNTRSVTNEEFIDGFGPEFVDEYEIGAKNRFFDNRLHVDVAFFYYDYKDIQVNLLVPGSAVNTNVFNAGKAKLYGGELDVTAVLAEGLLANLSYGYISADYKKVEDQVTGKNIQNEFIFPNAPKNSLTGGLDYTFPPLFSFGTLSGNVNATWVDDRSTTARKEAVEVGSYIERYYLLNASLTLAGVSMGPGTMQFSAWGKNLTDVDYKTSSIDGLPGSNRSVFWGEPRTFGLDVTYEF